MQSSDRPTCDLKSVCGPDDASFKECSERKALCLPKRNSGQQLIDYECKCKPGQHLLYQTCVNHCDDPQIVAHCASKRASCDPTQFVFKNQIYETDSLCRCNIGTKRVAQKCEFQDNVYTFNLKVSRSTYTNSKMFQEMFRLDSYLQEYSHLNFSNFADLSSRNYLQLIEIVNRSMVDNRRLLQTQIEASELIIVQELVDKSLKHFFATKVDVLRSYCNKSSYYDCLIEVSSSVKVDKLLEELLNNCVLLSNDNVEPNGDCLIVPPSLTAFEMDNLPINLIVDLQSLKAAKPSSFEVRIGQRKVDD